MALLKERLPALLVFAILAAGLARNCVTLMQAEHDGAHLANRLARVDAKADYAVSLAQFGDRVIDLPEDAHGWHTTVFTSEQPTANDRQLLDWFDRDPQLRRLKEQTHFHHYTPKSSVYSRYANLTAEGLPVLVLQSAAGQVIFKASRSNLPQQPWPLVRGIIDSVRAHCPHCPRPRPAPQPEPEPRPNDEPAEKPLIPDIIGPNQNTPRGRDDTVAVTAAVFVAAIGVGLLAAARRNGRGHS